MAKYEKKLRALFSRIREWKAHGVLEPEQAERTRKALKELEHSFSTKNMKKVLVAVDRLSAIFVDRVDRGA